VVGWLVRLEVELMLGVTQNQSYLITIMALEGTPGGYPEYVLNAQSQVSKEVDGRRCL
jgi:hypothetical protein